MKGESGGRRIFAIVVTESGSARSAVGFWNPGTSFGGDYPTLTSAVLKKSAIIRRQRYDLDTSFPGGDGAHRPRKESTSQFPRTIPIRYYPCDISQHCR